MLMGMRKQTRAVTAMGSDSYHYDNNGNQVTRNVSGSAYTLGYDAENSTKNVPVTRQVSRRRARQVSDSRAASATFVHDGDGKRT
jgi:hypothetical protein